MIELIIQLDSSLNIPLYEQIYSHIKTEIKEGRLCKNMKLPSTRAMAATLGVSRSTVDMAYSQLVSEGYVEAYSCKGYFVSDTDLLIDIEKIPNTLKKSRNKESRENGIIDFNTGGIDLSAFPFNTWRKITKNVLSADNKELFKIGNPKGDAEFREIIKNYLYESRGVETSIDRIIVGAGNDYLFLLLSNILGKMDIAMENPTYMQAYRIFSALGHKIVPVNLDDRGKDINALSKSNVDIAYVTPSHQFPTGIIMPIKRRLELLKWAASDDKRYIIEDDYDSEFRYVGKPIPSLHSIDIEDRVIYIGTLSRSIAPAIRMSYMVLPEKLMRIYEERLKFFSSTVSRIDQTIVKEFMEFGYFERHLNKMRSVYKLKHDLLISEINKMDTKVSVSGENSGVHIILNVDNGMSENELIQSAKKEGVKVYPLSLFMLNKPENEKYSHAVLLGFAGISDENIRDGIRKLDKAWKVNG